MATSYRCIVSAGETSKGVFIAGWHNIELDADKDGTPEMSRTGYAGVQQMV